MNQPTTDSDTTSGAQNTPHPVPSQPASDSAPQVPSIEISDSEAKRLLRRRNIAVALALIGFAVIFYALAIARLGPAVFAREM